MNVTAESYGHAVILNLKGELTDDAIDAFRTAVEHQIEGKEIIDLVLNMQNVPFVDSMALEYLLDLNEKQAEKLGQVKLVNCDENISKILEITRLDTVFDVFDDLAEAVKAVQAS